MIARIIVAGGGTGGHLFPGVAVVEELRRRFPAIDVTFVGTARGIEARVLPPRGEKLELLDVQPLAGRTPPELARSLGKLPRALLQAALLVRRLRPDVVIGVGGYASGPMLAAAALLGVRTAVLEQNAHLGMTNRLLSGRVGRAFLTFEETAGRFGARAHVVGNPVRRAFVDAARLAAADPSGFDARARQLLVLGGSQGAGPLNALVPKALADAGVAARGLEIVHQAGAGKVEEVERRYAELGVKATVVPFLDDMARSYARAQLVVSRAGASTLAELCAIGRASTLIPFPHAAGDHQTKNAEALAARGAAIHVPQGALEARLGAELTRLLDAPDERAQMAARARALGKVDAAACIVDELCAWTGLSAVPAPRGLPEVDHEEPTPTRRPLVVATGAPRDATGRRRQRRVRGIPVQEDLPEARLAVG